MSRLSRRELLRRAAATGGAAALGGPLGRITPALGQSLPPRNPDDHNLNQLLDFVPDYFTPGAPRGLHLSYADDVAGANRAITWFTSDTDPGSVVQWGAVSPNITEAELNAGAAGDVFTHSDRGTSEPAPFGDGDIADVVAPRRSPDPSTAHPEERQVFVHRATLAGLQPGQAIAYRVGDGRTWSPIKLTSGGPSFTDGFTFTHLGDHGPKMASRRMTRVIDEMVNPDLALIAGDISYANGDQRRWDAWFEQYGPLGRRVPTMPAPGNHEAKDFMGESYRSRFTLPGRGQDALHPDANPQRAGRSWYSFDYGNVHIVSTPAGAFFGDTAGAIEDIQAELLWMEQDLALAAAKRAAGLIDFIAVMQHFPTFTATRTRGPLTPDRVLVQEQILQRYQIDLLLIGHDHLYQRSHPMVYGQPTELEAYTNAATSLPTGGQGDTHFGDAYANATGYIQVIAGAGGNSIYELPEVANFDPALDEVRPYNRRMPWLAVAEHMFSFAEYRVTEDVMEVTGWGFDDAGGQVREDIFAGYDGDGAHVDMDLDPVQIDRFTLQRKAYAADVPTTPRPPAEVLADLELAHGAPLVHDRSEDCTLHEH